ncbi:MAG: hypothetical protein PGN34_05905 [Methylobacterium frigidaeris]
MSTRLSLLAVALALATPARAQIRNAPPPRSLETAAYIFAAANVCGYRIGVAPFETILGRYGVTMEEVRPPRGPFGAKVQALFTLMSNRMMLDREAACLAVAGEYGPEGSVEKGVLLPAVGEAPPAEGARKP